MSVGNRRRRVAEGRACRRSPARPTFNTQLEVHCAASALKQDEPMDGKRR